MKATPLDSTAADRDLPIQECRFVRAIASVPKKRGGDFSTPCIAIGVAAYRLLPPLLLPLLPMFELPLLPMFEPLLPLPPLLARLLRLPWLLPCCPRDVPDWPC